MLDKAEALSALTGGGGQLDLSPEANQARLEHIYTMLDVLQERAKAAGDD
jgi:hypothetical protein